ncbi:tRNA-dihydrouridine(47) synthase [NAD(P)(+)] [Wickerhamiella sorbophila]|uniref:tRNA-dihydrouridine(47) synthase [NAD(P)(+)] n=1 Tax=Wickerhamiella sorbophila TaxID=45607 RepID=A0A2T0FL02_9ASCO|nr:tRNA-dihydrouridine(47) synthase [NAD(P)(+)] [Wickerhamiella sorbophila]PRT55673.1 tRNA-dihydrouridine(47) synthase [NAD(P)(+)] [Wickerhamiella sorbophila]
MSEPEAKKIKVDRIKGITPIKPQYLVEKTSQPAEVYNDEDAESSGVVQRAGEGSHPGAAGGKKKKNRGQNKNRSIQQHRELVKLCEGVKDTKGSCRFGETCRFEHDIQKYIESKPADLPGMCPVFEALGYCPAGVKCRWLSSHFDNGKLTPEDEDKRAAAAAFNFEVNRVNAEMQHKLQRKHYDMSRSESYIGQMEQERKAREDANSEDRLDNVAAFVEGQLKPTEKKRLNYHRAKVLSPLTTVGNLPYRRLMKTLGVDVTFSEMALSLPLVQGSKSEWALTRAHSSEVGSFNVQIAAPKPWHAIKATQVVSELAPQTNEINLNCGCPIDLLFRQGAGSALMDNPAKIMRITRGMNVVSGDIPITIKIRTGTRDGHPTAKNLVKRLVDEQQVAAITIHGRSRAQRYTKEADWEYIKEIATTVKEERADRELKPWIIGNGDVYSWEDWYSHVEDAGVDTCMVARGALIKPWIFEEIDSKQYLDKSASERLEYLKQYANYGLEHWGSDEYGVSLTRRYLCEWMSFTHRYIPVGILEYLPPKLNDRPAPWQGRNEMETLLASNNYKDWIKITEMFLGPAADTFEFEPKHKSNSYAKNTKATATQATTS